MKRVQFTDRFGLTSQSIPKTTEAIIAPVPTNHIGVIDVSGSMAWDLPQLRTQLKNKLPTLVQEEDTITLIWFSGKNEYGVLQEAIPVRSVKDLSSLNAAIDRYLKPVGLTGFKQPLEEVANVIQRVKSSRPGSVFSLFFMSDGYDNQWPKADILKAVRNVAGELASVTIVEYGWNADRNLLSQMAEEAGGTLMFSENFQEYQNIFEREISKSVLGGKKIQLNLADLPALSYAFTLDNDGTITTYAIEDNTIRVPESVDTVHYFSHTTQGTDKPDAETYAGLATLAQRMEANAVFSVLGELGDVHLVNRFVNCFSKQDYTDFQNEVVAAALNPALRYQEGKDKNAVPKEDAYTVLELLNDLAADEGNLIHPMSEAFHYKRIGAERTAKDDSVKFAVNDKEAGVPVGRIVYNSERPNVSIGVRYDGKVTLPAAEAGKYGVPDVLDSFIFRNYTIIRDGIVHTRQLPLTLTEATIEKLRSQGLTVDGRPGEMSVLDISKLPVINRLMVKSVSAKETFAKVFELERLKGVQKVLNDYLKQYSPKTSKGYTDQYGEEAAAWLKTIGVTDYNGFNPPSETQEFNDVYTAKMLTITVAKLSSLPTVKKVQDAMASGKALTLGESLMAPTIERVEAFLKSDIYLNAVKKDEILKIWLEGETKAIIDKVRQLNAELAQTKFAIIVGHVWFNDLEPGEETLELKVDGIPITVTATLRDKEIGNTNN